MVIRPQAAALPSLEGKGALVTGGASGIGFASARRFMTAGMRVVIVDVDAERGHEAARSLGASFVRADVSRSEDWRGIVAFVRDELGGLAVAHLNAGVTTDESDIARLDDQRYRRVVGVNLDGVVFGIRALVPALEASGGGSVVVTASLAGLVPFPYDPIYTATKHALVGLVRSLAPMLEARGVRIDAVCPGLVDTPLLGAEARTALLAAGFPLIEPDAVGEAVQFCVEQPGTGRAVVVQPGRPPEVFRFPGVPGPRGEGLRGRVPDLLGGLVARVPPAQEEPLP
jgi:NAD(P)-dependent dehydrogenase (short-subunit alcohol dehydrogenase family)